MSPYLATASTLKLNWKELCKIWTDKRVRQGCKISRKALDVDVSDLEKLLRKINKG